MEILYDQFRRRIYLDGGSRQRYVHHSAILRVAQCSRYEIRSHTGAWRGIQGGNDRPICGPDRLRRDNTGASDSGDAGEVAKGDAKLVGYRDIVKIDDLQHDLNVFHWAGHVIVDLERGLKGISRQDRALAEANFNFCAN